MSLEHVGDAGGCVVVLGGELREEELSLVVQGTIEVKLWRARAVARSLPLPSACRIHPRTGCEAQDGIRVIRTKLFRQA